MIGDWLLSLAVVCANEAPFVTESEADESRVANDNGKNDVLWTPGKHGHDKPPGGEARS